MKITTLLSKTGIAALLFAFGLAVFPNETFGQANEIKFQDETLPNGLHVIYNVDRSAPVVATIVYYKVGSRDESPDRTGFAHFFEHLMFEATEDIPRSTIDKYVNEAGGTLNASTSFDQTVFQFVMPSNELKLALWIESERMRKLLVDTIGVETQRGVVKEERKNRVDNQPYGTLFEKMAAHIFAGGSYSWTPIGSPEHINKATIQEFRDFYNKFYQPNNATLCISGDFNVNDAKKYVRDYFGIYKKGKVIDRQDFILPDMKKEYREVIQDEKAQLPGVFIGLRGPQVGHKDYYAVSLLTNILASGESSRIYQRIVDKDQSAVQAAVMPLSLQYSGMIFLYGIASAGKDLDDIEDAMYDEIKKLIDDGITDEEFTKAKNINETKFVSGKKNVLSKARSLAQYYTYFGDANMINTEIDKYNAVTKDDLIRVAKKYFDTDKRVVLDYVPKKPEK